MADLATNVSLIEDYRIRLAEATTGAEETTLAHRKWVKGGEDETIQTDSGPLKTLKGLVSDMNAQFGQEVDASIAEFDTQFEGKLTEYETQFLDYLVGIGFEVPVVYEIGLTITRRSQTVVYNNEVYYWTGTLPLTTSVEFQEYSEFRIAPINGGIKSPTFSFSTGGTLSTPVESVQDVDGQWYFWTGVLPKVITSNSTIESAGGLGVGKFLRASGTAGIRDNLLRDIAGTGFSLNSSTFESGATISLSTELLYEWSTGKLYKWNGALPKAVPSNSSPATTGGVSSTTWSSFEPLIDMYRFVENVKSLGYRYAGNFVDGCTVGRNDDLVITQDKKSYLWAGSLPKAVSKGENPLLDSNWKLVSVSVSTSLKVISDVPPSNPLRGQQWTDSETLQDYFWYINPNGSGGQWVSSNFDDYTTKKLGV